MCGLVGFVKNQGQLVLENEIQSMLDLIRYRGPDDTGMIIDKNIGLGSVRLSIVGLSTGRMPIKTSDDNYWIVYNGEVYNHKQHRKQLEEKGHNFLTESDTEVVLHLYKEFGVDSFKMLNGMFGICIWDKVKKRIVLARDQLGQKPVYYAQTKKGFLFASEIKSILQQAPELRKTSQEGLMSFMTLGYTLGSLTMFEGVNKLGPGEFLIYDIDSGSIKIEKYWQLEYKPNNDLSYLDAKQALREKLIKSVESRMMSEVPVSIFLSGGIDSTVIGGIVSQELGLKLKSYALGYTEEAGGGDIRFNNDVIHAEIVAKKFGFDHHEYKVRFDGQLPHIVEKIAWHFDEPCYAPTLVPLYLLSKVVAKETKVSLTGDGGDELFCGYEMYNIEKRFSPLNLIPECFRSPMFKSISNLNFKREGIKNQFYRSSTNNSLDRYLSWREIFRKTSIQDVISKYNHSSHSDFLSYMKDISLYEKNARDYTPYLAFNDILFWISSYATKCFDHMSMASSLEVRSSYLDHELVQFSQTIPYKYKLQNNVTKSILKDAFADCLPPEILTREKGSMLSPSSGWIRRQLNPLFNELFSREAIERAGLLDYEATRKLFDDHISKKKYAMIQVWSLAQLQLWHEIHIQGIRKVDWMS